MGILTVGLAYLIGALPMGLFIVKVFTGRDITSFGSGRTGGTNAMRVGGVWIGLLTSILDVAKGFFAVWIARWLLPEAIWIHILAGIAAVFGHNWSLWVYVLRGRFSAGAGTGPNIGAAIAFWPTSGLILAPTVVIFVMIVGYASLASLVTAAAIPVILLIRALTSTSPWEYAIYGVATAILVAWSLRPNLERLYQGTERRVGLPTKLTGKKGQP